MAQCRKCFHLLRPCATQGSLEFSAVSPLSWWLITEPCLDQGCVPLGGELPEVWSPTSQAEPRNGPATGEDLGRIHQEGPQSGHRPGDCCAPFPPVGSVPRQCSWRGREDEVSFRGGLFIILIKLLQVRREALSPQQSQKPLACLAAA